VVVVALEMHRPCQCLLRELPAPGESLHCPGIPLPQKNALCCEICLSTADWAGRGSGPLSNIINKVYFLIQS